MVHKSDIRFNILFWSVYFLYEWLGNASVEDEYLRYLINALVIVPLTFLAAWVTVHLLFKKYFIEDRKLTFWLVFIISVLGFTLLRRTFNYYYTYPLYFPQALLSMPFLYWPKLLIEAVNTYLIVGFYAMFYFFRELYKQQRISQELREDKLKTELKLLKAQVQPHFIFNTLNNIYSMAKQGHPKTADLIYRLSGFLSYNLYDSGKQTVTVAQEVDHVKHYIELEKIRHDTSLDIAMNIFDSLEGYRLSPMLLLPLVENAFKHGFDQQANNGWIRIDLSIKDHWLTFKVENSSNGASTEEQVDHSGIGLDNLKKRLAILYPEKHYLQCRQDTNSYLVTLKLKM